MANEYFSSKVKKEEALRRDSTKSTTLTAWFALNLHDPAARSILYQDIPSKYVFDNEWRLRHRGGESVIGRVANISPRNVEAYHLRLLLLNVSGATSFDFLKTFDAINFGTYREAALARDLIIDESEWRRCMEKAELYMMPFQLRSLFSVLLIHCDIFNAMELWVQFRQSMIEDFIHNGNDEEIAANYALLQIQTELQAANITCEEKGLPIPVASVDHAADDVNEAYIQSCASRGAELFAMLNPLQRTAADDILMIVNEYENNQARCFFIDVSSSMGPVEQAKHFFTLL